MKSFKALSKKKKIILAVACVAVVLFAIELIRSNSFTTAEEYTFESELLPSEFDGVTIVQISDFHNAGESYCERLLEKVEEQNPDYIFITGDIADSVRTDVSRANYFLERVSELAPCYLVWGNHDVKLSKADLQLMKDCCAKNGITVLDDSVTQLERNGQTITIAGTTSVQGGGFDEAVKAIAETDEDFVIWLHHYPEDLEIISGECERIGLSECLMFSGHAHGGLIGLPFGNGAYAPGQSIFPEYVSGEYEDEPVTMLLSAGAGNSGYTLRLFNPFDIVVCELSFAEN